jgi:hypothetical protein
MGNKRGPKYSPFSKEFYIHYKGMTEEDAIFEANSKKPSRIEYWLKKGFSEREAKERLSNSQKKKTEKLNIKKKNNFILDTTKIEYWLSKTNGNLEEAKKLFSERQSTFSKEKCIKKYGEGEGVRIWEERQEKWLKTLHENNDIEEINQKKGIYEHVMVEKYGEKEGKKKYKDWYLKTSPSLENFKSLYGEEEGKKKYNEYRDKHSFKFSRASKESLKIFLPLVDYLVEKKFINKEDFFLGVGDSHEYFLRNSNNIYFYDFTIPKLNIILEFNGKMFHPNKDILSSQELLEWKQLFSEKSAEEVLKYDSNKKQLAEEKGFKVFYLWEGNSNNLTIAKEIIENEINSKGNSRFL